MNISNLNLVVDDHEVMSPECCMRHNICPGSPLFLHFSISAAPSPLCLAFACSCPLTPLASCIAWLLQVPCSLLSVFVNFWGFPNPEYTVFELGSDGFDH